VLRAVGNLIFEDSLCNSSRFYKELGFFIKYTLDSTEQNSATEAERIHHTQSAFSSAAQNTMDRPDTVLTNALMARRMPDWRALRTCFKNGGTGAQAFRELFVAGYFWLAKWLLLKGVVPGAAPGQRYPHRDYDKDKVVAEKEWCQMPVQRKDVYFLLLRTMRARGFPLAGWETHY
jgi:hypothetical protein